MAKVAICPPLHKLLFQLLIVVLLDLQFLGKGCVLVMLSTCQYACNDIKFFCWFQGSWLGGHSIYIIKMITWIKSFNKGHNERHRACLDVGIPH
jgi:hypothetical protein